MNRINLPKKHVARPVINSVHESGFSVNPGDPIFIPGDAAFIPGSRVITARIWIVVRGLNTEPGLVDTVDYRPGDVILGVYNDNFRRMQVSKTILLRNART